MRVIDLFSGLGGFSEAFLHRGHAVVRYDNDERFLHVQNTIIKDVLDLTMQDLAGADVVLASPPCRCFSVAADHYHWPNGRPTAETLEQIRLVEHTVKIIMNANPEYWILENPAGRMRNVLGKPAKHTAWCAWGTPYKKPTDLWGKIPPIDWRIPRKWEPNPSGGAGNRFRNDPYPRDPARRALIPYQFSLAVCLACEGVSSQQTLI